uniref:Family with sequence similarity 113 n=1 Tax=Amphilophus citrinellus TaxID=61819 RepID=A0A3Q0S362_AMPCI
MKSVSHLQASQLLHNKFIVVLGDSIQRSVYKDLVLLLQKEKYLSLRQLKTKGEMSFEQDCLVEGGCLDQMHNGTQYREVRQFQSAHHLVRFYFVTRIYSHYMQTVLEDFRHGLKPDVVIVNSCVWDISRWVCSWDDGYKENLHRFFDELHGVLPEETLVVWNLTMPLGEKIRGGFLVPEVCHHVSSLRYDVIEANFYSGTLADAYGMDVLDLHFQFRFSLQHRMKDGIHWNAVAHRKITSLVLQHAAEAWGVILPYLTPCVSCRFWLQASAPVRALQGVQSPACDEEPTHQTPLYPLHPTQTLTLWPFRQKPNSFCYLFFYHQDISLLLQSCFIHQIIQGASFILFNEPVGVCTVTFSYYMLVFF